MRIPITNNPIAKVCTLDSASESDLKAGEGSNFKASVMSKFKTTKQHCYLE
ncbi:hypothetical protein CpB0127 [Chlamydia pneumoniae TW-183]|uniref:Uncharacterized protein n=1 Tax=Chlamydia pneumoniae TaxID=83558 RepID=A0ABN3YPH2_CHLPN|nr:hypothetical protein CpB0127 [Chlamydia pneumoniae TW-183]